MKFLNNLLSKIQLPNVTSLLGLGDLKDSVIALLGGAIVVIVLLCIIWKFIFA